MATIQGNQSAPNVLAIAIIGVLLTSVSFGLRIWARSLSPVRFGLDDVLMGIALVFCLGISANSIIALVFGLGYHDSDLSEDELIEGGKTVYAFFFLQTTAVTLIKLSLLLFYLRTFPSRKFRWTVYVVGAIVLANTVTNIFGFALQCIPPARFWNHRKVAGYCINQPLFITLASTFPLLTDFAIYLMPMPAIWGLQMDRRRKIEITFIFVIGGFISLTGVLRLIYTIKLDVSDLSWSNVNPTVWNMVESEMGYVAANLLIMGPVFGKLRGKTESLQCTYITSSTGNETQGSAKNLNNNHRKQFIRINDDRIGNVSSAIEHSQPNSGDLELGPLPLRGISVTRTVEQHSAPIDFPIHSASG